MSEVCEYCANGITDDGVLDDKIWYHRDCLARAQSMEQTLKEVFDLKESAALSDQLLSSNGKEIDKLKAYIRQLENEGFDAQCKLGILEKEVVSLVPKLHKYANELEAELQRQFIMVAGGMTDKHTAIATLLEQP